VALARLFVAMFGASRRMWQDFEPFFGDRFAANSALASHKIPRWQQDPIAVYPTFLNNAKFVAGAL